MLYTIPLSYNPIDIFKLTEVLSGYAGKHHNQIVTDFEEAFKKITGAAHAVALNSGTSAIHLALKVLGVGPGDVVVVPTFTYVATVNPVLYLGAQPVFIDSESESWNMDPSLLEKALDDLMREGKKPKAIIVVHTYGMPANMEDIARIGREHGIPIVEDAAESLGSTHHGKSVGLTGDLGVFSFNNNKIVTSYGGGMLVAKDIQHAKRVRFLASQAREDLPYYEHREVGYNYAISPLSAAYGLSQLPDLRRNIVLRRRVFEIYREGLSKEVQFQPEKDGRYSNRWFSGILFKDEATKLSISSVLMANGIETRPLWNPIHQQPVYQQFSSYLNTVSDKLFRTGLCLPSSSDLVPEQQQKVIDLVVKSLY